MFLLGCYLEVCYPTADYIRHLTPVEPNKFVNEVSGVLAIFKMTLSPCEFRTGTHEWQTEHCQTSMDYVVKPGQRTQTET
jgi:hypothetical protein